MTFLAAGWLLLFVPLAAIAWLVSRRVTRPISTSAAWLWTTKRNQSSRPQGRRAMPPPWMIATLCSAAAAIVALAGPARRTASGVVVIVDPSARLTADLSAMWTRVEAFAEDVAVPGQPDARSIEAIRPTARNTEIDLAAAIARERRPAIVLSDAAGVKTTGPVVRPPPRPPRHAISRLAARDVEGVTNIFVRAERDLAASDHATITMNGVERSVAWPAGGATLETTFSIEAGDRIVATLDGVTTRLARDGRWGIQLATRGDLSEAGRRFAEVFARERSGRGTSIVTLSDRDDSADGPRVILAAGPVGGEIGAARRTDHPVLVGVPSDVLDLPPIAVDPPPGFTSIAWRSDRPTVAVGTNAVWIALDASTPTPAWVALVDSAVRWAAGSLDGWSSVTPDDVPQSGWTPIEVDDPRVVASPGWYRDGDGVLRAVNAAPGASVFDGSPTDQSIADFVAKSSDARRFSSISSVPAWVAAALAFVAAGLSRLDGSRGRI